jgi:hypothetical protein
MTVENPQIEPDPKAAEFIRAHGGALYVWMSDSGLEHETTKPKGGITFSEYAADGFTLHVDRTIQAAHLWRLVYHRLPRPRVRALWNGAVFSPSGARVSSWEGGNPFS